MILPPSLYTWTEAAAPGLTRRWRFEWSLMSSVLGWISLCRSHWQLHWVLALQTNQVHVHLGFLRRCFQYWYIWIYIFLLNLGVWFPSLSIPLLCVECVDPVLRKSCPLLGCKSVRYGLELSCSDLPGTHHRSALLSPKPSESEEATKAWLEAFQCLDCRTSWV